MIRSGLSVHFFVTFLSRGKLETESSDWNDSFGWRKIGLFLVALLDILYSNAMETKIYHLTT